MEEVASLSNQDLLAHLLVANGEQHKALVRVLVYLGEVDARGIHCEAGYSTMNELCAKQLGYSARAAHRRLVVARAARRFPIILTRLERGEVHLTAVSLVAPLLTEQNHEAILVDIIGKTTREVRALVVCLAPKPHVETSIVAVDPSALAPMNGGPSLPPTRIDPRSAGMYRVEFMADQEMIELLEEARERTRHLNRSGDYVQVLKSALKAHVEQLRKQQDGASERPQTRPTACKPGTISRATRREVVERDGRQCAYVAADGTRCSARSFVQLHHIVPRAEGGGDGADNLKMLCAAHHALETKLQFGAQHVEQAIERKRQKKKAPSEGHSEGAANSAAEGGGGGGGNSVTASANPNLSSSPGSRPSSEGSAPALRATRGARAVPSSPSRRTGS